MKALIAEDAPLTREALATILTEEGYTVVPCPDGAAALRHFKAGDYALVCLDVMMPGASGYDVCKAIRILDPEVPVLFISAKSEEIDKVLGLELGADDFMVKPFGVREVLARIRAIERRVRRGAPDAMAGAADPSGLPFTFGPWTVAPSELRAWRDHQGATRKVDLSPRELAMLLLLSAKRGQVVSRGAFFRSCWDLKNPPLSRTLDQHIATLRKKLEEEPGRPGLITTVQGVGYRYEA